MKYLKLFNENNEDELKSGIFELNGEINADEMEICFIDLMDDGIIKKISMTPIVDRWQKVSSLTVYFNIHFVKGELDKNESVQKYIDFKVTRFRELFEALFPNYKIIDIGAKDIEDYDLLTRNCDTIKVVSTIPLPR